jgi:hypothetical protein
VATTPATQAKPTAVVEIERLGFGWNEVAQYDLTRLDVSRRVQVREVGHYAQKDIVEQFAIQMGESQFPPIVVTADDWIVDGNTRVGAALRRKAKFFPAFILDVRWGGASEKQQHELSMLAATLNAQGGVRLTAKETREVAAKGVALGWKAEQIGRAIGLAPAGVTAIKKEIEAATKLRRVGLDPNGSVKGASLRALGAKDVLALNDVPFRELAKLATDASLNAGEITSLAKQARETGSDAGAVTLFTTERTEMGDRIRERELTGIGKPPVSRQLRQHLGFVTKYAGKEHELLETDPKVSTTHIEALTNAIAVLTAVLEMQRGPSS